MPRIPIRPVRFPGPRLTLYAVLAALLIASVLTWVFERGTSWANNWLPNFIAEWSGILIVALVVERLTEAHLRQEQEAVYGSLRQTAGVAIGRALQPMINFLLSVAETTGLETKPGYPLVRFLSELWDALPRPGIVDPRACFADWVDTIAEVEKTPSHSA